MVPAEKRVCGGLCVTCQMEQRLRGQPAARQRGPHVTAATREPPTQHLTCYK